MTTPTYKTVNVEFSHSVRDDRDVTIDLNEYREWLGISLDEDIDFEEADVIEFLNSGPEPIYEVTGYVVLDDFRIEQVNFERDC